MTSMMMIIIMTIMSMITIMIMLPRIIPTMVITTLCTQLHQIKNISRKGLDISLVVKEGYGG